MRVTTEAPIPASQPEKNDEHLRLLIETGLLLASERSLDVVVQAALDTGLRLCGAQFGAFFYNNRGDDGEPYQLYKVSGPDPGTFAALPTLSPAQIFEDTFLDRGAFRSADITQDPRYSQSALFRGMRPASTPVRSYLAVPVRGRGGEVLGGLLYGHADMDVFAPESEDLVATVASQAAGAIDNVRLADNLTREIAIADAARALQIQTAERLRQALEAAQLGTWTWDRASDLLDLDERCSEMFGVPAHVPITRTALRERIVLTEDLTATTESLQSSLESGGLYQAEYRVDTSDGIQTWISASGVATFNPGVTAIAGMIGTAQNITARKTSEATLRQSEKLAATGRLAATIAHEINNPLEAVTNLIYLCKTDPAVPEYSRQLLETADAELARVAQIAQQTLGFYRDTTRPVKIDLNTLIEGVVGLFQRKMQSLRIDCVLDLEPGLRIFGLQGEVRQVFSNLLVNAIDASLGNTTIRIRSRHRVHHGTAGVCTLITDQGSGISSAAQTRLFTPFFTTKESVGTGLGLWVTRGIVEKQGGRIHFRSRTESPSGTVFRVFLPAFSAIAPTGQTV
jgi:PAS domain S-box-containing protein